LSSLHCDP
jgi:hypothetical protein